MRGAGDGPWPDLPTIMCGPSFLELQNRLEVRKYWFRSTIPLLFPFSLFICCLSEDIIGDVQIAFGLPLPMNRLITLIIVPVFLGLGRGGEGGSSLANAKVVFSCGSYNCRSQVGFKIFLHIFPLGLHPFSSSSAAHFFKTL